MPSRLVVDGVKARRRIDGRDERRGRGGADHDVREGDGGVELVSRTARQRFAGEAPRFARELDGSEGVGRRGRVAVDDIRLERAGQRRGPRALTKPKLPVEGAPPS